MKTRLSLIILLAVFFPMRGFSESLYEERETSLGTVIMNISRNEALDKFGYPAAVKERIWEYPQPHKFFIYFPAVESLHIYPLYLKAKPGIPYEYKVFAYTSNLRVKDVTSIAQLIISEADNFRIVKPGLIIPRNSGDYYIVAKYRDDADKKDILSVPSYINIAEEAAETDKNTKEEIIDIEVLPYRPIAASGFSFNFVGVGTFFNPADKKYSVRDISQYSNWMLRQLDTGVGIKSGREIYLPSPGRYEAVCQYQDLESASNEFKTREAPLKLDAGLKYITVLPKFIFTSVGEEDEFRAFATYNNNKVEDITSKVSWEVEDEDVLELSSPGRFVSKMEGISNLTVQLGSVLSLPVKALVVGSKEMIPVTDILSDKQRDKDRDKDKNKKEQESINTVKNGIDELQRDLAGKRKIILLKINPDYLKVRLGEDGHLKVTGVYDDNSEEDLTLLVQWVGSDNSIANVYKGVVYPFSVGQVKIYAEYEEVNPSTTLMIDGEQSRTIKSQPATVVVEGARLISIILSPDNSRITLNEALNIKAKGYYSDASKSDISAIVNWNFSDPRIIKVTKNGLSSLRVGHTKVYAEYSGIQSLPVNVTVILPDGWLVMAAIKILSLIFLVLTGLFFIFYILRERRKRTIVSLYDRPKEFIIGMYENLRKVMQLFGVRHERFIPPLSYAKLVQGRYPVEDDIVIKLTAKFEEAKYSRHILGQEDAGFFLENYNSFLKVVFSHYDNYQMFLKYCLSVFNIRPLTIGK